MLNALPIGFMSSWKRSAAGFMSAKNPQRSAGSVWPHSKPRSNTASTACRARHTNRAVRGHRMPDMTGAKGRGAVYVQQHVWQLSAWGPPAGMQSKGTHLDLCCRQPHADANSGAISPRGVPKRVLDWLAAAVQPSAGQQPRVQSDIMQMVRSTSSILKVQRMSGRAHLSGLKSSTVSLKSGMSLIALPIISWILQPCTWKEALVLPVT